LLSLRPARLTRILCLQAIEHLRWLDLLLKECEIPTRVSLIYDLELLLFGLFGVEVVITNELSEVWPNPLRASRQEMAVVVHALHESGGGIAHRPAKPFFRLLNEPHFPGSDFAEEACEKWLKDLDQTFSDYGDHIVEPEIDPEIMDPIGQRAYQRLAGSSGVDPLAATFLTMAFMRITGSSRAQVRLLLGQANAR